MIGTFYSVSAWAVISGWGENAAVAEANANPGTMVATTTENYLGSAAGDVVQVLLVSSLFACVLSFHNVLSRYLFALGNAAVLPSRLGSSHARHHSPHISSIAQTVTAACSCCSWPGPAWTRLAEVFAWLSAPRPWAS